MQSLAHLLLPALVTPLALGSTPLAQQQAPGEQQHTRAVVEATFDPEGPYDDAGYAKDPYGMFDEEALFAVSSSEAPRSANAAGGSSRIHAAPSNDACASATIIPGSTVSYFPGLYSTTTATTETCEASESCGGIGTSNTVWYSYSPDQDGVLAVDTFGSNYDTVLSVWSRCSFQSGIFCVGATELGCNNDFGFGVTSQVYVDVFAGQTYKIKVAAAFGSGGGTLDFNMRYIPSNDNCVEPTDILGEAFNPPLLPTFNAQSDVCEPNETCEFNGVGVSNSVWYRYTPPCDGMLHLNTNGSNYDTVLSMWDGCSVLTGGTNCNYPSQIACDDDSGTGTASQMSVAVNAGVTYLIKVADYNTTQGGGYLDFNMMFSGSDMPTADLASPTDFGYACASTAIQGTADAAGGYVSWVLDFKDVSGGAWTFLASSQSAVTGGTLATWNTSGLTSGYYHLRLTVSNACGLTETDSSIVWVDQGFSSLALRLPAPNLVYGQSVSVDGTIWDPYFRHYTLEYRPLGSSNYSPLDPATPQYATPVTTDPLIPGGWNTIAQGIPDGDYELRARGVDLCNYVAEEIVPLTIDNTPPFAEIKRPAPLQRLRGNVAIRGSASDANLKTWTLEVAGGTSNDWTLIAQGNQPVNDGLFTSWATDGLAPGPYTLRLRVTDSAILGCGLNHVAEYLVAVHVGKASPVLE